MADKICPLGMLGWQALRASGNIAHNFDSELYAETTECKRASCGWWCEDSKCCGMARETIKVGVQYTPPEKG